MLFRKTIRRKVLASLFGLVLFAILSFGSTPTQQVITFTRIYDQVQTVIQVLELVDQVSSVLLENVDNAYQDLGGYLQDNNFSPDVIISMEEKSTELDTRFLDLKSTVSQTNSEAEDLFQLMRLKADENTNPEFKQVMLSSIEEKENSFNLKITDINNILSETGESIQQYKDILGLAQVTIALDLVDDYVAQVNTVLFESEVLSADVKKAIEEAIEIIKSSEKITSPSSSSSEETIDEPISSPGTVNSSATPVPDDNNFDGDFILRKINEGPIYFSSTLGKEFSGRVTFSEFRTREGKPEESGVAAAIKWNDGAKSSILFMKNSRVRVWEKDIEYGGQWSWNEDQSQLIVEMDKGARYEFGIRSAGVRLF